MTGHTRYTDSKKEKPYYYYYCNRTVNYFSGLEERECLRSLSVKMSWQRQYGTL